MRRWVNKANLREIRPAESGEMVYPGQFAKPGDIIIIERWEDTLVEKRYFEENYVEVEVPD